MSTAARLYLIAYDISCPQRWRRVQKAIKGICRRNQLSVFLCRATPARRPYSPDPEAAKQNHRRHHIRCRRRNPLADIILERIKLLNPLRRWLACRRRRPATQIAPHRVPRPARRPCNCTDAAPMLGQN